MGIRYPTELKSLDLKFDKPELTRLCFPSSLERLVPCLESYCLNFLIYEMLEPETRQSRGRLLKDSRESLYLAYDKGTRRK